MLKQVYVISIGQLSANRVNALFCCKSTTAMAEPQGFMNLNLLISSLGFEEGI